MNLRRLYGLISVVFFVSLLFVWGQENRTESVAKHLETAKKNKNLNQEGFVVLEDDLLLLKIQIKSGRIVESRLKNYGVENHPDSLGVRVFGSDPETGFKFYMKTGFVGKNPSYVLKVINQNSVVLEDPALGLKKEIKLDSVGYEVSVKDSIVGGTAGKPYASVYRTPGQSLDLKRDVMSGGMMTNSSYEGVGFSTKDEPYDTYRFRGIDEPLYFYSKGGWVAYIQKYFFSAFLGSDDYYYRYFAQPKNNEGLFRVGYTIEPEELDAVFYEHEHRVFIGPKIRSDLLSRSENLELSIDMGWFWFISQPMVFLLDKVNGVTNHWGLSIVVVTLLLKILLWPVTAAGFRGMAKMRKVNPLMRELNEAYKNDPQKLRTEMMKLYSREKANPLAGCLPAIVQMPFFIAFFFVLREMVELRYAPLGFWISDLAAPDPLFVLPFLFGVIMFLTQKLNPQPPTMDATQANVMKYMPVVFSLFFVIFPAGLALYTVVNSGVSLIQQRLLYKKMGAFES
jgi:YidC/Oxa1 family membrane protein insertase